MCVCVCMCMSMFGSLNHQLASPHYNSNFNKLQVQQILNLLDLQIVLITCMCVFFTLLNSRVIVVATHKNSCPVSMLTQRDELNYIGATGSTRKWCLNGSLEDCCNPCCHTTLIVEIKMLFCFFFFPLISFIIYHLLS